MSRKNHEFRFGLVMYGGISLAIYTYGVSREFYDVVKGKGVYADLKRILDSDVVVDIISGTSAGGVNGVALGRALAVDGDLGAFAKLWREKADLLLLLQDPIPRKYQEGDDTPFALMRSNTAYADELENGFRKMGVGVSKTPALKSQCQCDLDKGPCICVDATNKSDSAKNDVPSDVPEIDLFITTTNIQGRVWQDHDSRGRTIGLKNHQEVFHLKHRVKDNKIRKSAFRHPNDDDDDQVDCDKMILSSLAQICRATSALPVVFHPVPYDPREADVTRLNIGNIPKSYMDLFRATLSGKSRKDRKVWFADGGLLDNKPFSMTVEAIQSRAANRPVDRKIFYVEPDPEEHDESDVEAMPTAGDVGVAGLFKIPMFESIASDLKNIRTRNRAIAQLAAIEEAPTTKTLSKNELEQCLAARIHAFADILKQESEGTLLATKINHDHLVSTFDSWLKDKFGSEKRTTEDLIHVHQYLDKMDPLAHLRQYRYALYQIFESEKIKKDEKLWQGTIEALFQQHKKLEIIDHFSRVAMGKWCEQLVTGSTVEHKEISDLEKRLLEVLACSTSLSMEELYNSLKIKVESKTVSDCDESTILTTLWDETEALLTTLIENSKSKPKSKDGSKSHFILKCFEDAPIVDRRTFAMRAVSGIGERDKMDLIRVSPRDALNPVGYGRKWHLAHNEKISGDAILHFGGFLKKSWRSNDIFWGRLDNSEIIIETLLRSERFKKRLDAIKQIEPENLLGRAKNFLSADEFTAVAAAHAKLADKKPSAEADEVEDFLEKLIASFVLARSREIAQEEAPRIKADLAQDCERECKLDSEKDSHIETQKELSIAAHEKNFAQFDRIVKRSACGIGNESAAHVSATYLFQATTRLLLILIDIIGVYFKAIRSVRPLLAGLQLISRTLGLGKKFQALLLTSFLTATILSGAFAVYGFLALGNRLPTITYIVFFSFYFLTMLMAKLAQKELIQRDNFRPSRKKVHKRHNQKRRTRSKLLTKKILVGLVLITALIASFMNGIELETKEAENGMASLVAAESIDQFTAIKASWANDCILTKARNWIRWDFAFCISLSLGLFTLVSLSKKWTFDRRRTMAKILGDDFLRFVQHGSIAFYLFADLWENRMLFQFLGDSAGSSMSIENLQVLTTTKIVSLVVFAALFCLDSIWYILTPVVSPDHKESVKRDVLQEAPTPLDN